MTQFPFIEKIIENGGDCYLFGGAIRNEIIGTTIADYDFIVKNLSVTELLAICSEFGVALSHKYLPGAIRLHIINFGIIDISIPKINLTEYSPNGTIEKHMSFIDFTMNCIVKNVQTLVQIDFYNGVNDIQNGRIVLNPTQQSLEFSPMAPLRAARFVSTFGFSIDDRTCEIFHRDKEMLFKNASDVRLQYEMHKLLMTDNRLIGMHLLEELDILQRLLTIYNKND